MYIQIATTIVILWILQEVFTAIARITPTKKDDGWAQTSRKILEIIGKLKVSMLIPDKIEIKKKRK